MALRSEMEMTAVENQFEAKGEGRPYRSHLHPACFSCRKRKSRCKTRYSSAICIMCQAHGTECVFPRPDDNSQPQVSASPRRSAANVRRRFAHGTQSPLHARSYPAIHHVAQPAENTGHVDTELIPVAHSELVAPSRRSSAPGSEQRPDELPNLIGIVAEAGDDSSHIVSPAVAGDNEILESYLSAIPTAQRRCLVPTGTASNRPLRPVRFNVVPRRPLGVPVSQTLAASKCELIEKYMDPDIDEYLNLFFQRANVCFPIFDETSFRSAYSSHKDKISSALLCSLYANSLVYGTSSSKLSSGRTLDIRFVWNQANEALHSELFLSPGISTVMSILINVCGRPSTSMFGNGGMVGTAVALSNALGLNRDPSGWSISPLEKSLRIRLWWLVLIHDRWCNLAYGTPLQVHRAQYDVPFPTVNDICAVGSSPYQKAAASVFVALTTLTDVLARYLEYVYSVSKSFPSADLSALDLEQILSEWEESLPEDLRRFVMRGTNLHTPGAANFRLAYLAVKLLLRRIQLDLSKSSASLEDDTTSPYSLHAQRAAEDIAHLMQELDGEQLCGFWIPVHAFSITSATMFLLRSGLRLRDQPHNMPLKVARNMIHTLQAHRQNFDWDLADDCLSHCSELVERIGMSSTQGNGDLTVPEFPDLTESFDIDPSILEGLFFGVTGFSDGFEI